MSKLAAAPELPMVSGPPVLGATARWRAYLGALPRPGWLDLVAAALIAYVSIWNGPTGERGLLAGLVNGGAAVRTVGWALVVLACCVGVLLRRVVPTAAVVGTGCVLLAHLLLFGEATLAAVGTALVMAETCTSRLTRPWSWGLLGGIYLGGAAVVLWAGYQGGEEVLEPARAVVLVGISWSFLTVAALTGVLRRRARERVEQALERARVLAAQQDAERRLAVVTERQRIARDVHDLLGHSLSVIGMQAAGAKAVLITDPAAAEQALTVIGETSRSAVDEVRALVDVLRADCEEDSKDQTLPAHANTGCQAPLGLGGADGGLDQQAPPYAVAGVPALAGQVPGRPGVEELPALVSGARRAGLPVTLHLDYDAEAPAAVAEAVYRLVQESLTNVLRHAQGAETVVGLSVDAGTVVAEVVNEGPVAATVSGGRQGCGLVAMRERVEALGGTVKAGPTASGGWRVRARLPLGGRQ